jgi:hypothetical protein
LRRHPRHSVSAFLVISTIAAGFHATYAIAETRNPWAVDWLRPDSALNAGPSVAVPAVSFGDIDAEAPADDTAPPAGVNLTAVTTDLQASQQGQEPANARPRSFEYSHGYEVRRKIHVYSSYATLPLFAAEIYLGEKLYRGGFSDGERTAHQFVAGTIGVLFGVNTVTGVWNLKEGWGDPAHHKLRVTHGLLMLGADAGFVATGMMAPNREGEGGSPGSHRAMAYTSIGIATASYLLMLFGR